jgi:hypothetical protein
MTYSQVETTAEFAGQIFAGNTLTLMGLKGQTITNVEVVNNLEYKGEARCGLLLTIGNFKLGLHRWDMNNILITEFPKVNETKVTRLTDVLHTAAFENFGKEEKEWLEAIAAAIKGKKADCYTYNAQTAKGKPYQGAAFTVTE